MCEGSVHRSIVCCENPSSAKRGQRAPVASMRRSQGRPSLTWAEGRLAECTEQGNTELCQRLMRSVQFWINCSFGMRMEAEFAWELNRCTVVLKRSSSRVIDTPNRTSGSAV